MDQPREQPPDARRRKLVADIAVVLLVGICVAVGVTTTVLYAGLIQSPLGLVNTERLASAGADQFSAQEIGFLRQRSRLLTGIAAYRRLRVRAEADGQASSREGLLVTVNYFSLLGVSAQTGRLFVPSDESESATVAVVVEGTLGRKVGDTIRVQGVPLLVVGTVRRTFRGTSLSFEPEIYVPFWGAMSDGAVRPGPLLPFVPKGTYINMLAEVRPGLALAGATTEMRTLLTSMPQALRSADDKRLPALENLDEAALPTDVRTSIRDTLLALGLMFVGVVTLGVANASTFVGLHMLGRSSEFAVRQALGATRVQLLRLTMLQFGLRGALGGVLGLMAAAVALHGLSTIRLAHFVTLTPRLEISQWLGLTCVVVAALAGGLIAGGWVWSMTTTGGEPLRSKLGPPSSGRITAFEGLAVAQLAVAMALLGPAVAIERALHARTTDALVDGTELAWLRLDLALSGYKPEEYRDRLEGVRRSLSDLPEVRSVSLASDVPRGWVRYVYPAKESASSAPLVDIPISSVSQNYFETLSLTLRGSAFSRDDVREEVVVNDKCVDLFWAGRDPIGRFLRVPSIGDLRVVGVVTDERLSSESGEPHAYVPLGREVHGPDVVAFVRGRIAPQRLRIAIRGTAPDLPVSLAMTMQEHLDVYSARFRLLALVSAATALLAMILALAGVYVTTSFLMRRRMREIAIRLAVGGQPTSVARAMALSASRWSPIGLAVGLFLMVSITTFLRVRFVELAAISSLDGWVAVVPVVVSLAIAVMVPAVRAVRADPFRILQIADQ